MNHAVSGHLLQAEEASELQQITDELLLTTQSITCSEPSLRSYCSVRSSRHVGGHGAPRYNITADQLEFLVSLRMTDRQIATVLHVSINTVRRRMREFQVSRNGYTPIDDVELNNTLIRLMGNNRRIGPNSALVRLQNVGIRVQRWRVREALHRIDPAGSAMRAVRLIRRRPYRVPCPNSLWHLDGNHKLIRWKMVIHGAIDGYSRLVTFMRVSNNNNAETVFRHFVAATHLHGVPSRLRVDYGGENNLVCEFMEGYRGNNRGSVIRGSSVHNQRIERLWSDVWSGCTNIFWDIFRFMEEEGFLDPSNNIHMFALHYIFLPRIQSSLDTFVNQWNNHGLRTERAMTPRQLFVRGTLENIDRNISREILRGASLRPTVVPILPQINETPPLLSELQMEDLQATIDPLHVSEADHNTGIELYIRTVAYITDQLGFLSDNQA